MDTKQEQIITLSQQENQTEILDIKKPEQFKTLPQAIPRESTLLTESNESALLSTEKHIANISNIEIIPEKLTPVQDLKTILESGTSELKLDKTALKTKAVIIEGIDSKKPIEIYQADVKESAEPLKISNFAKAEARQKLTKHEYITEDKPLVHEDVSEFTSTERSFEKASLIIRPLEAQSLEETVLLTSEGEFVPKKQPITAQARQEINPLETVKVSQVIESESVEEHEHKIRVPSMTLEPTLKLNENIEVSEVFTEDRPDKYYPELIVPTESATEKLIEYKSYVTRETLCSEHEKEIISKLDLPKVVANIEVLESLSLQVEEATLADKESIMKPKKRPETFKASREIGLLESVTTEQADLQSPIEDRTVDSVQNKNAEVKVIEQEPISSQTVDIQEPITNLELSEVAMALGKQELSTFVSTLITESTVHESFQDLKLDSTERDQKASQSISTAQQAASYQQIMPLESFEATTFDIELKEATILQTDTYLISGEQCVVIAVEKEDSLKSDSKPTLITLKPTIGEHDVVVIEQTQIAESEQEFPEKLKPPQQTAKMKSNLQKTNVVTIDEPQIVYTTGAIEDLKIVTEKAQVDYEIKVAHSSAEQMVLQGTNLILSEDIITHSATSDLLPQTAVEVTVNYPLDSESLDEKIQPKTFKAIKKPDEQYLKSCEVQEVTPHFSVAEIESLKTDSFIIDISLSENISKTIGEDTCLEEEGILEPKRVPAGQSATTELDICEYLEHHKAFLNEKEILLPQQELPAIQEAKLSESQRLHSPTVHGIQTLESLYELEESVPLSKRAKHNLDELDSLVSSDVICFETSSNLKEKSRIEKDSANIEFIANKPLEVSISKSAEKESYFEVEFKPNSQEAKYVLDDCQRSIEVTEMGVIHETEDFETKIEPKESIKHIEGQLQPIFVSQSISWDKESPIQQVQLNKETVAISEEPSSLKAPLTEDVIDNICLLEFSDSKPILATGNVLQDTLIGTITSAVQFVDSASELDILEKPLDIPVITTTEGFLAPAEFTQIVIDQSTDFITEFPSMKNVITVMTEGGAILPSVKGIIQTEETTNSYVSSKPELKTSTKSSIIQSRQVAISSEEVTFGKTSEIFEQAVNKPACKSITEAYTTTLQEVQIELESVSSLKKPEIVADKSKISLTQIGRIAPLITSDVESEREGQLEEQEVKSSVAVLCRENPNVTSLTEIVFPSLSIGETDKFDSTPKKAILKQEQITPLLTEEQTSLQQITETFDLDLKTSIASTGVITSDHLKGVTSEEMLVFESSVESKYLTQEAVKGSQTLCHPFAVPTHSIMDTIELAGTFDSRVQEANIITEKLEPANTAAEQSVIIEQFKEGNLPIETHLPQYLSSHIECHKSVNIHEVYPLESQLTQHTIHDVVAHKANSKGQESISLISESITALESLGKLDNTIVAARPMQTITENTELQSLQHTVSLHYSGKYIDKQY